MATAIAGPTQGQPSTSATADAQTARQDGAAEQEQTAARNKAPAANNLITHGELTDLRALQRTFDGAYVRTALAQLSYAIIILRLFEEEFYWCGMVYVVLAIQLIVIATYRYNLAMNNQSRGDEVNIALDGEQPASKGQTNSAREAPAEGTSSAAQQDAGQAEARNRMQPPETPSNDTVHMPLFRPTFRTAGTLIAFATSLTLILELALAALIIWMP